MSTPPLDSDREIATREEFATFLAQLADDLRVSPEAWARTDLGEFLYAMAYWTKNGLPAFHRNLRHADVPEPPTWRVFADILEAARVICE
jgi:hypothetical protein